MSKSQQVLEFVRDNRGITLKIAADLLRAAEGAARKLLERLERRKKLRSYRHGDLRYWTLHPREARGKLSLRRTRPLGEKALLDLFGRFYFGRHPGVRRRYSEREFRASFPDFVRAGLLSSYYLDSRGPGRLGLIVVHHGQRPKRLTSKLHHLVSRRVA